MTADLHKGFFVLAVLLTLSGGGCVSGTTPPKTLVPAFFADGQNSFEGFVEFPEVDGDLSIVVRCLASVKPNGEISRGYCLPTPTNGPFIDAIGDLDTRFRLAPARVRGKNTSVWMHYTVHFSQQDGVQNILVFPHHQEVPSEIVGSYTAPQLYKASSWPVGCRYGVMVVVSLVIDESGKPIEGSLVEDSRPQRCAEPLLKRALNATYIPASRDGMPVKATYFDAFFTRDVTRRKSADPVDKTGDDAAPPTHP